MARVWRCSGIVERTIAKDADGYQRAAEAFERAIRYDPSNADAYAQYAAMLALLKRDQAAIDAFAASVRLDPDALDVWKAYGVVSMTSKKWAEAIVAYRHYLDGNPKDVSVQKDYVEALFQAHHYGEALIAVNELMLLSATGETGDRKGDILVAMGRYEDALTAYNAADKLSRASYSSGKKQRELREAVITMVDRLIKDKRDEEALILIAVAKQISTDADIFNKEGGILVRLQRYQEAATAYRVATEKSRNYGRSQQQIELGNILKEVIAQQLATHQEAGAVVNLDVLCQLEPSEKLFDQKGDLLASLKRYKEAMEAYNAADNQRPSYSTEKGIKQTGLRTRIESYLDELTHIGKVDEALALCELLGDTKTMLFRQIGILAHAQRYQACVDTCAKLLNGYRYSGYSVSTNMTKEETAIVWEYKGDGYVGLQAYQEAHDAFKQAESVNAKRLSAMRKRGQMLILLKKPQEALVAFDAVLKQNGIERETLIAKFNLLFSLNKYRDALVTLDKILALAPDTAAYWRQREALCQAMGRQREAQMAAARATYLEQQRSSS